MAKTSKNNPTGRSASVARTGKSKPRKKSSTSMPTSKGAAKGAKETGHDKRSKTAAVLETPTKPSRQANIRTRSPRKGATKSGAVPTTPSTVSSRSTTESKRAASLMSNLHLKSPMSKSNKDYSTEDASLVDSVDYNNPAMISWRTIEGVACAVQHHYPGEAEKLLELSYEEQILLVMQKYKPADMRSVLQGLLTESGKDWRKLNLNRLKTMRVLGPEFVKTCVEWHNATAEIHSPSVPANVVL